MVADMAELAPPSIAAATAGVTPPVLNARRFVKVANQTGEFSRRRTRASYPNSKAHGTTVLEGQYTGFACKTNIAAASCPAFATVRFPTRGTIDTP
jgi:hypothetical protein